MESKSKILVVENEKIIALDIKRTLIDLGYDVVGTASRQEEAILKASRNSPDLILMDISLDDGGSGIEAATQIKEQFDIPIIYLTALADEETIKRAKVTEPFGYLLKPYDIRTLHSSIEMALYKNVITQKLKDRTKELEEERIKSNQLLQNILPKDIVNEMKEKGFVEPKEFKSVTLLFTDFQEFTTIATQLHPRELVDELNDIFQNFDSIIDKYELEKLKTIGDSYMVASGLPNEDKDHAYKIVAAAYEMQDYLENRNSFNNFKWTMRAGVHSGPVIAGIVGKRKFTYDVWGNTVNIASLMERLCLSGKVNISEITYDLIKDKFNCTFFKDIQVSGEGNMKMFLLDGYNNVID